ncbi:MAG: ABC transporter ATP-binding protein, partial [Gammaproteobacteria bacterium]|nr:ABC transporter ATP-binding protein [Gammaproteobacteria bacterium]
IGANIAYGMDATDDQIRAAAEAANAWEFIARMPQQLQTPVGENGALLSGGQRQRLAIARALIVGPQLLVLDEPTSALDVTVQKQVLALLQRLQRERGLSYLLITHDVDVIAAMAHEVVVMKDGALLERGHVDRVLQHPQHPYTQALVRAAA